MKTVIASAAGLVRADATEPASSIDGSSNTTEIAYAPRAT